METKTRVSNVSARGAPASLSIIIKHCGGTRQSKGGQNADQHKHRLSFAVPEQFLELRHDANGEACQRACLNGSRDEREAVRHPDAGAVVPEREERGEGRESRACGNQLPKREFCSGVFGCCEYLHDPIMRSVWQAEAVFRMKSRKTRMKCTLFVYLDLVGRAGTRGCAENQIHLVDESIEQGVAGPGI
jgi:hypothetical protein